MFVVCRAFPATRYFPPVTLSIASYPQKVFDSYKVRERDGEEANKGRERSTDLMLSVSPTGRSSECDDRKLS